MYTLKQVQARLLEIGIHPGPIDGLMGSQTRRALEAFQRMNGLSITGQPDAATIEELFPDEIPGRDDLPKEKGKPKPSPWPRDVQADLIAFYGQPGSNQVTLTLPFPMRLAWAPDAVVRRFSIHRLCHDSALRALTAIGDAYSEADRREIGIDLFGGCLNVRKKRGGSTWSVHAFGAAIDFDPARNGLRSTKATARLARPDLDPFWRAWEAEGWVSLGRARNFDWMHVQAARV